MRRARGEGTLVQRADGRWTASLQVGGRRVWVYGRTKGEAAAKLRALHARQVQGCLVAPSRVTVADYLAQWLAGVEDSRKPSTAHGYAVVVRCHLTPTLGGLKLQQLAPAHLARLYQQKRQQGLSSRRVAIIHAVLHTALAEAVRWRLVPRNVAADVRPPRDDHAEPAIWSLDELRRFVAVARTSADPYAPAVLLALALALRAGELLGLTWDAVDRAGGQVQVRRALTWVNAHPVWGSPKSRAGRRTLGLAPLAQEALDRLHRQQAARRLRAGAAWKDTAGRVVTTRTGGVPAPGRLHAALTRLCAQAGVARLTVHGLRHQCASVVLAAGVDVKQVQRFLGHSRAAVTLDVYSHAVARADSVGATLQAVLDGAPAGGGGR